MKLITCLPTPRGNRTTVMQGLDPVDAHALANAACMAGGDGRVLDDGPQINMREWLKAHAEKRKLAQIGGNVTPLWKTKP